MKKSFLLVVLITILGSGFTTGSVLADPPVGGGYRYEPVPTEPTPTEPDPTEPTSGDASETTLIGVVETTVGLLTF